MVAYNKKDFAIYNSLKMKVKSEIKRKKVFDFIVLLKLINTLRSRKLLNSRTNVDKPA